MRNHLPHIIAATLLATTLGCGGRTAAERDRNKETGGQRGLDERIALRGCVQPASDGQGYTLNHVIVLPSAEQPGGEATLDHRLIARGSWVRLAGGIDTTADLKAHLNNEVTITGDVVDTGQSTIGTAGHSTAGPPAASSPSVANGDAPRVAVEKLQEIADNCAGD